MHCTSYVVFFFFKQKTAYELRISDWSSDVCSSDLCPARRADGAGGNRCRRTVPAGRGDPARQHRRQLRDRKSVVEGKSVSVRVDVGCRRIIKKKINDCSGRISRHKPLESTETSQQR